MKWIVITLFAGLLSGRAAAAPEPTAPQGNRYLFVFETSSAMARLPHAGRQAVFDLIHSGLENRMRPGDTFGVWTFQKEVSAGDFPMQVWDPEKKLDLASRVGLYLKERPYKGKPALDEALARIGALVRSIKDVNVILVCSAEAQPKEGRPFAQMQPLWQEKASESRKEKKPIVLTLALQNGEIVDRGILLAGEPLELPFPPPPPLAATNAPAAAPITNLPPRIARANIIMQGPPRPKLEPTEAPAITNAVAETHASAETNAVTVAQISSAAPPPNLPKPEEAKPAPAEAVRLATAPETKIPTALLPDAIPVAAREKPGLSSSAPRLVPVAPSPLNPTALILAGSGLMAVGLTIGAWLLISSRKGPQLSSISQSMSRASQR